MLTALRNVLRLYESKLNSCLAKIATLQRSIHHYEQTLMALEQDRALFELNLRTLVKSGGMNIDELREMRRTMGRVRRKIADIAIRISDTRTEIIALEEKLNSRRAEERQLNKKKEKYLLRIKEATRVRRNAALCSADNETEEMSSGYPERGTGERHNTI